MSEENKGDTPKNPTVDTELSDLLDSALEDFKTAPATEPAAKSSSSDDDPDAPAEWSEDFIRQCAAQFESNFANLLGSNPDGSQVTPDQVKDKFKQIADVAQEVIDNPTITDQSTDFASTITQTIQGLSQGAEGLQNPFSDQDLMGLLGGSENPDFMPFMQGMMQSLLSKDVLYPSLKDILDKFPDWLRDNKEKISKEDFERYQKQQDLMEQVCNELNNEKSTDSDAQKKERFESVLVLMQKLQDYGQPPTDLVGEVGPPLPLDVQNSDPNQCILM